MINSIFNLFIFYLFYLLFFVATFGYGKLINSLLQINKKNFNYFEIVFYGLIFYLILGFLFYTIFGNNYYLNFLVLIFGLWLFFNENIEKKIFLKKIIFFLTILFSGLLISKTHEDFPLYHFFSVQQIFENNLTIGLPLVNFRFVHASLLSYVQSLYVLPFFNYKLIHLPVYFIYLSSIGYFLYQLTLTKNKLERFFCFFLVTVFLVKLQIPPEYQPQSGLGVPFWRISIWMA